MGVCLVVIMLCMTVYQHFATGLDLFLRSGLICLLVLFGISTFVVWLATFRREYRLAGNELVMYWFGRPRRKWIVSEAKISFSKYCIKINGERLTYLAPSGKAFGVLSRKLQREIDA